MEEKMVKIPFDVELAKKIQAEEHPGSVITREGKDVRILCFDAKNDYPIVALLEEEDREERIHSYKDKGRFYNEDSGSNHDLFLQVPEWTQYKEGDVLDTIYNTPFIFKAFDEDENADFFAGINAGNVYWYPSEPSSRWCSKEEITGYASEEKREKVIDGLKKGYCPNAKEYLKRFFGIEVKPKCEFQPYDRVLVRCLKEEKWLAAFFSHYDPERSFPYRTTGDCDYTRCIPYNEKTKHLVGTTDEWEEE